MLYYRHMVRGLNSRVIGAGIVGIALVAGAWVLNSLQTAPISPEAAVSVATAPAPVRAAIPVTDSDSDGVEDWREPLLTAEPVILNAATATYTRTNTVTERVGIALMENYFLAKSTGKPLTDVNDTIAQQVFDQSLTSVNDTPYSNLDLTILPDDAPDTIRTYINAVALTLNKNDLPGLPHNVRAFEQAFLEQDEQARKQLTAIAAMYQQNCLDLLALPVPSTVRSEHLSLVNTMCSMSKNLTSMVNSTEDPALALLRLKRYEEDEAALAQAVIAFRDMINRQNFSLNSDDPARMFLDFGSTIKS